MDELRPGQPRWERADPRRDVAERLKEVRDLMLALSEVFGKGGEHYIAIPRTEAAEWQRKVAAAAVHLDGLHPVRHRTSGLAERLERRAENLRTDAGWVADMPPTERVDAARRTLIAAQFRGAARDIDVAARLLREPSGEPKNEQLVDAIEGELELEHHGDESAETVCDSIRALVEQFRPAPLASSRPSPPPAPPKPNKWTEVA